MSARTTPEGNAARNLERDIATALETIPGVRAAAVRITQPPFVERIDLALEPGTSIPDTTRAALELVQHRGLTCPPDAIHAGILTTDQLPAPEPAPPAGPAHAEEPLPEPWQGRFLLFDGIKTHRAQNRIHCRVRLLHLGQHLTGQASDVDTPTGRARAASRATLRAARKAAPNAQLALEGALILQLFGRSYVAVTIDALGPNRTAHLAGLVAIDRTIEDAASLATVRAIERWIAW